MKKRRSNRRSKRGSRSRIVENVVTVSGKSKRRRRMSSNPVQNAIDEQLQCGLPTPDIPELRNLYWKRPRYNETILVEMLDRQRYMEARRERWK